MYHFLLMFSVLKKIGTKTIFFLIYLSPLIDCSSKSGEKLLEVSADVNSRVFPKLSKIPPQEFHAQLQRFMIVYAQSF